MNKHRTKAYLFLFVTAIIWGIAAPVIKFTLNGIDPLPFLAYRFILAGFVALIYLLINNDIKTTKVKKNLPLIILYGVLAFPLSLGLLFYGLNQSGVLDLTLITILAPLAIIAGGALIYRDHITKREKTGISIAVIGTMFATLLPILNGSNGIHFTGNIALLLFLVVDVSGILLSKKLVRKQISPMFLINLGFLISAVVFTTLILILIGPDKFIAEIINLELKYHLGVWYMAFVSGTLAYYLSLRGYKTIEVSEAALFKYLQPLFAVPLAVIWLGESITPIFIIGAIIITIGIVIAEIKKK